jgi:hypothetical protein
LWRIYAPVSLEIPKQLSQEQKMRNKVVNGAINTIKDGLWTYLRTANIARWLVANFSIVYWRRSWTSVTQVIGIVSATRILVRMLIIQTLTPILIQEQLGIQIKARLARVWIKNTVHTARHLVVVLA